MVKTIPQRFSVFFCTEESNAEVCNALPTTNIKIEPMTTDINENEDENYADHQGTLLELKNIHFVTYFL